ncbi:Uncharacterised protein [Weissella viridescens]|uniref:Ribonuclease J C-terminal domain-containing protein n=1 Tax=Weissella viridescens TaxID=1629 RepID=A0A380P0U0_WEIVI|nr:Uncharacterised protein [Weissella viridescens]
MAKPKLDSRGFVYVKTSKDLMQEASDLVEKTVSDGIKNTKSLIGLILRTLYAMP